MGQTNRNTHTGINNGELSEFVLACAVISKRTNLSLNAVHANMELTESSAADARSAVHGCVQGINYFGDGKMIKAYKELGCFLRSQNTDSGVRENVRDVINSCFRALHSVDLSIPFDSVENMGASGDKDDLRLLCSGQVVDLWSVKWKHEFVEKSQSPNWDTSVAPFYGKFADVSELKELYERRAESFLAPQKRTSARRGDWTPALQRKGLELLNMVTIIEAFVGARFVNGTNAPGTEGIDPEQVARGYIDSVMGKTAETMLWIELGEGRTIRYRRSDAGDLAKQISHSQFTVEQSATESGKTRDTRIFMNEHPFIRFRTTVSADSAGVDDPNMRRVKRQTYLDLRPVPSWPVCNSAHQMTPPRSQRGASVRAVGS